MVLHSKGCCGLQHGGCVRVCAGQADCVVVVGGATPRRASVGGRLGLVGGGGCRLEQAQPEAGERPVHGHVLPAGASVMSKALKEVGWAAELPSADGEGAEGGPPWLGRPVGHEG